jgi:glycosyltransferase involved in cell wall biosynthesis
VNHNPTFTIAIPVRNGEKYLSLAIRSALRQTRPAGEILIVDDHSTDNSADIARSTEWGGRVTYFFNEAPTGFADAWNRAAALASGVYISILHQDDLLHPEYLATISKALKQFPEVGHFYTASEYIDADGIVTGHPPLPYSIEPVCHTGQEYARMYLNGMLANRHIHRCPGVTTSRALLMGLGGYRKDAGHIADDDFFLRIGAVTDVVGIFQPLARFRNHGESETGKQTDLTLRLAADYLYQISSHRSGSTLLDSIGIAGLEQKAVKFINLLLFQGIESRNHEWVAEAYKLRRTYEALTGTTMTLLMPRWGRLLWLTTRSGRRTMTSALYGRMIREAVAWRRLIAGGRE